MEVILYNWIFFPSIVAQTHSNRVCILFFIQTASASNIESVSAWVYFIQVIMSRRFSTFIRFRTYSTLLKYHVVFSDQLLTI